MPPRHGKSTMISHHLPAWWLMRFPHHRIILTGYGNNFATTWGEKAKAVFEEFGPQALDENEEPFGLELDPKKQASDDWRVKGHEGGMFSAGVGGSITGRGADLFIIDDAVKNAEEAASEVYREKVWDWFVSTADTRLEPGGRMIIMMTRWHEDDLVGRLLSADEDFSEHMPEWEVINFPALAEAEPEDVLGRKPGEALFPARFDEENLKARKRRIEEWHGPYWWSALYQQRPTPLGGGMFKDEWFQFFEIDELNGVYVLERNDGQVFRYRISECSKFVTVDPAFSEKRSADWTVIGTWARTPNDDLLKLDMIREHIEGASIADRLEGVYEREGMRYHGGRIYVESVGGGLVVAQQGRQKGLPVEDFKVETDKQIRAMGLQARMSHQKVYFPKWWSTKQFGILRDEFLVFPNGRYDDIVDESSMAAKVLAEQGTGRARSIKKALR